MVELLRTNDAVLLSFVRALLEAERIQVFDLDQHASVMDGSMAMVQRRLMVDDKDERAARQLLKDADLGHVLKR
jgi:7-keto-8-aminopelargonate synthetase-like enzyme